MEWEERDVRGKLSLNLRTGTLKTLFNKYNK